MDENVVFSVTLWRNGFIEVVGKRSAVADSLRILADALDAGLTTLSLGPIGPAADDTGSEE